MAANALLVSANRGGFNSHLSPRLFHKWVRARGGLCEFGVARTIPLRPRSTLYMSSSVDGVEAAMIAHQNARSAALEIIEIDVEACRIVDLRTRWRSSGIDLDHAVAAWQDIAAAGGTPSSWTVRDRVLNAGANGLIDPSRKSPGLWYCFAGTMPTLRPSDWANTRRPPQASAERRGLS